MSNLILIDGPPGSGKSSLAHELASLLPEYRLLLEMDTDHPLHPMPVGDIGAGFDGLKEMGISELSELLLSKWSSFLATMTESCILESYPYQSHVRVLWQMNASPAALADFLSRLNELLRAHDPLLVMLRVKDGTERTKVVFEKRGREWEEFIVELVSNTARGQVEGLFGLEGALSFLSAYESELEVWSGEWPFEQMGFEAWESSPAAQAAEVIGRMGTE